MGPDVGKGGASMGVEGEGQGPLQQGCSQAGHGNHCAGEEQGQGREGRGAHQGEGGEGHLQERVG
jgi:hypothetical protein